MLSDARISGRGRIPRRRRTIALLALAVGTVVAPLAAEAPVTAQTSDSTAAQAAAEIQAARDRANAAAQAMWDAESELDTLDVTLTATEADLAAVEAQAAGMRSSLQQDAQRNFANAGASNPLLIDLEQANDGITADRQAAIARGAASVELDDFDAVMKEVDAQRKEVERQIDATTQARAQFEQLKANAEAEVVHLAEVEKQRLHDEAVQRELDRQRAAKLEQERAAAAAAQAAADKNAAAAAASSSSSGGSSSSSSSGSSSSGTSSSGSSGSSSSGSSQGAATPAPPSPPPANAGSGIVCPVAGPRAFGDTWGAARSGGRSHEGVDMMSPGGTPLVAVESGYVQFKTTNLGGNSVWLNGGSGTRYFYAHLSAWEGSSRNVSRGEVIGYVGATGNTSANHLHFEVHPGGGRAVNPYPYVRAVC
ncbi:MAG: peptidoglycan DD-metalloendopeptidase family protein [Ilumatobacteraceae bacterium]